MSEHGGSPAVITIDGPGGVGKSTVSRLLAERLGWHCLDSGLLYRALARIALKEGVELRDEERLLPLVARLSVRRGAQAGGALCLCLDGEPLPQQLPGETLGKAASRIAALPRLRAALLPLQHAWRLPPGLVAEGRDMGSVVFPDSALKIFLDASLEERSRRRLTQLKKLSNGGSLAGGEQLRHHLAQRDTMDKERAIAPLLRASDGVLLDTGALDAQAVVDWIVDQARQRGLL